VAYRLDGPNGLPIEGWWYATKVGREWGAVGLRDVVGRYFEAPPQQIGGPTIALGKAEAFEGGNQMAYMGVDAQYFCAALIPQYERADERWISAARPIMLGPPLPRGSTKTHYVNVTARMVSEPVSLKAGEKLTHRYQVFVGPKRPELISQYHPADSPGYSVRDFVYYGWFGGVARAMVGLLHLFYSVLGNYGLAIIALTVLVRGCMFPVSRGQARSMAKLQELRPEMEKIKEKYKGDQQKQAQAMQQLYRKYNVNPLAGCLPMLIQLPVFVGLWRGLAVDIELRQAPLFGHSIRWCSNLAAPDMFFDWSGFMPDLITRREGFLWLGPYLNLLPLVTIGLFLWQQKMFMPEPANEQAAMQQKVMKWMMVVMSVFFYKVPSGLCLYLIASSLWGIAERKLVPPATAGTAAGGAAGPSPAAGRAGGGGGVSDKRVAKNGQPGDKRGTKSKRRR
jgi:YidC/Oxa1 family membrane protein insertase